MPRHRTASLRLLAVASLALLAGCNGSTEPEAQSTEEVVPPAEGATLLLTSSAFAADQAIPAEFTCTGAGGSPPLSWTDPPQGTQSFALVMEDPDAPAGTFRHWGVYNLAANRRELAAGAGAEGAEGLAQAENDFGDAGYGGPCPPEGDPPHHYHFRLLALDVAQLPEAPSDVEDIADEAEGHVLSSTELVGLYGR